MRWAKPIPIDQAESAIAGFCLLNDWSARDLQAWEYQPSGPFLAKNFLTSVSPWVVTPEAMAPFMTAGFTRPDGRSRAFALSRAADRTSRASALRSARR